jgi:Cu-Zn family superoxide dismutase
MRALEFTETSCKRTRAKECSCSQVKSITEGETTVIAQCELQHSDTVKGNILLMQAPGTPTLIKGTITGLEPGEHGFHIHEFGDMSKGCESMGAHYNPDGVDHGDLGDGHVGDLGNITADESGTAKFSIRADRVDLIGDRSVVGRGIVVHADEDDLGKGGDEESLKTGNAGDRLACGVITLRSTK